MDDDRYAWYTLNREIIQVQKDKIIDAEKLNGTPGFFKESKLSTYALVIAILLSIVLGSGIFFLSSLGVCFILFLVDVYKDYKNMRRDREEYDRQRNADVIDPQNYCYQEYLYEQALQDKLDEDNKAYYEALERQKGVRIRKDQQVYDQEEEINLLVEMIENYFYCYKLPPLRLSNKEWDAFFDVLYDSLGYRDLRSQSFHIISEVIRYTLAKALVNEQEEITLDDFLDSLDYLYGTNSYNGIVPDDISLDDIEKMKIAILSKIRK